MKYLNVLSHTVMPFQDLHDILRIYSLPLYAFLELNPSIDVYCLVQGQVVRVIDYATASAQKTHTIKKDENVLSIAKKYCLSIVSLLKANPNLYPKDFVFGKTIILP